MANFELTASEAQAKTSPTAMQFSPTSPTVVARSTHTAPSAEEIARTFREAMEAEGIAFKGSLTADGLIHRVHITGHRTGSRNGWYVLHLDGIPAGAYGDYKRDLKAKWTMKGARPLTRAERAELAAKAKADRAQRDAEERARQAKAADRALVTWEAAAPATDDHPYLKRKGVPAFGLRCGEWVKEWVDGDTGEVHTKRVPNALLVPLHVGAKSIVSLQGIFVGDKNALGRNKDFLTDGRKLGCYFVIGAPKPNAKTGILTIIICEGYATGASIHMATGALVIVAFDAGNLLPVAKLFRSRKPDARIVIAADNDAWTDRPVKNPGVFHATEAALAVAGIVAIPEFKSVESKPTDFNDLHMADGLERSAEGLAEVKRQLAAAMRGDVEARPEQPVASAEPAPADAAAEPHVDFVTKTKVVAMFGDDEHLTAEEREALEADGTGVAGTILVTNKRGTLPSGDPNWESKIIRSGKEDLPRPVLANATLIFRHAPAVRGVFGFDEFAQRIVFLKAPPWNPRANVYGPTDLEVTDSDIVLATEWIQREGWLFVTPAIVAGAIEAIAREFTFHPVREYLNGLLWDGVPRIGRWVIDHAGADDTEIISEMSSKFLIAAVARVFRPGCKADAMLILEGDQGQKKSTALQALASASWFANSLPDLSHKDSMIQLQGKWIIEISELTTLDRASVGKIKGFLSSSVDRFRTPHGRYAADHPRQCVFAGTVNPEEGYLRDATGARRFWPIKCGRKFDAEALAADRDQLWAEAVECYRRGDPWWLREGMEQAAAEEQEARFQGDAVDDVIAQFVCGLPEDYTVETGVSVGEVMLGGLNITQDKWTAARSTQMRISAVLKRSGWTRRRVTTIVGKPERSWRYFPPPRRLRHFSELGRGFHVWQRTPTGFDHMWFFPDAPGGAIWTDGQLDPIEPPPDVIAAAVACARGQRGS